MGVMAAVLIMLVKRAHKPESVIFTNSTVSLLTLSFACFAAALMAYRAVRNKRYDSHMLVYQVPLARYSDTYNGQPLWYVALARHASTSRRQTIWPSTSSPRSWPRSRWTAGSRLPRTRVVVRTEASEQATAVDRGVECRQSWWLLASPDTGWSIVTLAGR